MIDLEIALVKALNWSLHDIDETDVESLLEFVGRLTEGGQAHGPAPTRAFCDQVSWL